MSRAKVLPSQLKLQIEWIVSQNQFRHDTLPGVAKSMNHLPLSLLLPTFLHHSDIISAVKFLVLAHNILYYQNRGREGELQKVIKAIQPGFKQGLSSFQKILFQKLVNPYKLYLLKRNIFDQKSVNKESQPYLLINLLNTALSFVNIIFTLGRYLFKQYQFLKQFNIILAKDLSSLYRKLRLKLTYEFCLQNVEILELLNDNLYTVFYNCYFSKYVAHHAPYWIDTDKFFDKVEEQLRQRKKKMQLGSYRQLQQIQKSSLQLDSIQNLSINIENNESLYQEFAKTSSTIASHREVEGEGEETPSQKEIRERLEFIAAASMLLNQFKQNEGNEEYQQTSLTII